MNKEMKTKIIRNIRTYHFHGKIKLCKHIEIIGEQY